MTTLEAAIVDLDGLLIDSEPLWREAEIEVFAELGVTLSEEDCRRTQGLRIDRVVAHWQRHRPWQGPRIGTVSARIVERMLWLIENRGQPMPGVDHALSLLETAGLRLALASSSEDRLIHAALARLQLAERFEVVYSAEHEPHGKPHPAVYLTTAERLAVDPQACVALEDSVAGVIAAKAAGMACIAVPERALAGDPRYAIADCRPYSLNALSREHLTRLGARSASHP